MAEHGFNIFQEQEVGLLMIFVHDSTGEVGKY